MSKQRVIEVVADWVELDGPTLMGYLTATPARGKEVFAFEYDKAWLSTASRLQLGSSVSTDLEQLWRRIVFFICVSNTDDHLRNHGFMLEPTGWALAPTYDMNSDPHGAGLKLNISETDNAQDLELALSVASVFRVKKKRALELLTEVTQTTKQWRSVATSHGLPRAA